MLFMCMAPSIASGIPCILTSSHWTTSTPHCNGCNSPMCVHYDAEEEKKEGKNKRKKSEREDFKKMKDLSKKKENKN